MYYINLGALLPINVYAAKNNILLIILYYYNLR